MSGGSTLEERNRTRGGAPTWRTPFRPAWWLPHRHLQTIWGRVFRRGPRIEMRRETRETPDGDVLELDRVDGPAGAPILVALHGLEGCSQSLYMHGLLDRARARGWRGIALNFRSCAAPPGRPRGEWVPNRAARMYHSGETSDLDWLIGRLHEEEPGAPIVLVGVSLGGNVLLKWLGERGAEASPPVRAAATISVPYDLALGSRALERGLGRVYVRAFLKTLKEKAIDFDRRWPGIVDVESARRARTFWEFDDASVAPIHGFTGAADYYARASSLGFLHRIEVPTLLISAADDPFQPGPVFPRVRAAASESVTCLFTERGAHAGFVAGPPWAPRCWDEDTAIAFLAE